MRDQIWFQRAQGLLPTGYAISKAGVARGRSVVTATPVFVDGKFLAGGRDLMALRVCWLNDAGESHFACLPVADVISGRWQWGLELARLGIEAGAHNHKALAGYLMACSLKAPAYQCQLHAGWGGGSDGTASFAFPYVGMDTEGEPILADPLEQLDPSALYMLERPAETLFATRGNLETWMKACSRICKGSPLAALAVHASILSPLLKLMGGEPFAILWSGRSGCGKGTAVSLAASVWGNPALGGFLQSWGQPAPSWVADLPVCLDNLLLSDTRRTSAGIQEMLLSRRNVMVLASGLATVDDLPGEESIKSRLMRTWGRPFSPRLTVQDIADFRATLAANHGHFGDEFLRRLMKHRGQWPRWFEDWAVAERRSWRVAAAQMPEHVQALSSHCADLLTASRVVQALFPGFLDPDALKGALWAILLMEGSPRRSVEAGAVAVQEFCTTNAERLYDPTRLARRPQPDDGWIGAYDARRRVWVLRSVVDDLLRSIGLNPTDTVGEWTRMGGLVIVESGRAWNTVPLGPEGQKGRAIAFKRGFPSSQPVVTPRKAATSPQ